MDSDFSIFSCDNNTTADSGVDISMSGGESAMRLRIAGVVSPCLTWTVRSFFSAYFCMRRNTSRFNALSGVMYRQRMAPFFLAFFDDMECGYDGTLGLARACGRYYKAVVLL